MVKRVELKPEPAAMTLAALLDAGGSKREEQRRSYVAMQEAKRVALRAAREECLAVIEAALDAYAEAQAKGRMRFDGVALAQAFGISLRDFPPDADTHKHLQQAGTRIGYMKMGLQGRRTPEDLDRYNRTVEQLLADANLPWATDELLEKIDDYAKTARVERRALRRALKLPQVPEDSRSMGAARQRRYRENHPERWREQSQQQQLRKKAQRAWKWQRDRAQRYLTNPIYKGLTKAERALHKREAEQSFEDFFPVWDAERQRWEAHVAELERQEEERQRKAAAAKHPAKRQAKANA